MRRHALLGFALAGLVSLAACGPKATPTPVPTPTPAPVMTEKIRFTTEDGITLSGTLFKSGTDLAVVLAHQGAGTANQSSWRTFATVAARSGITAFAFDFRADFGEPLDRDVVAAIQVLRGRGYARIACIGASMGGTACLKAGVTEQLAGIGIVGSTWSTGGGGVRIQPQELATLTMPKLFVTSDNDRFAGVTASVKSIYNAAPEPKQFQEYPGTAHGTEIFGTAHGAEFRALLLEFLVQLD